MRNTIFAFVSMLCVAGCGDTGTVTPVKDLSVKANPDLTQPLSGCNGLLMCYIDCNTNPGPTCFEDCDAGSTQAGLDLLNAFGNCIDAECFATNNVDTGVPYCCAQTDPNYPGCLDEKPCDDCYARILGTNGACRDEQNACTANKP